MQRPWGGEKAFAKALGWEEACIFAEPKEDNVDRAENGMSDVRGMYLFPGFFLPLLLLL